MSRRNTVTMPFVKLDTGILDSTLWMEREQREVFITSLLLAEPYEISEPMQTFETEAIRPTDFLIPPGWYGFVRAANVGIIHRAGVDKQSGMIALRALSEPDPHSRSKDFEGRRMVRVDGGFIVLNYMKYRDRDYTAAERQRRLRERRKANQLATSVTRDVNAVTRDSNVISRIADSREQIADAEKFKSTHSVQSTKMHFSIPSLGEVSAYCQERGGKVDPQSWFDHYTANGWKVGRNPMKDWRAAVRQWERSEFSGGRNGTNRANEPSKTERRVRKNREAILDGLGFGEQLGHREPDLQGGDPRSGGPCVEGSTDGPISKDRK